MEKNSLTRTLLKTILVLLIVLVVLISFLGLHQKELTTWKKLLPDYTLSKELSEIRTFGFEIDKSTEEVEEPASAEENNTEETAQEEKTEEENTSEETTNEETAAEDAAEQTTTKEVPVNAPEVLNAKNYKKNKEIIEERLKYFGITDIDVNVNTKTGYLTVNVPYEKSSDYAPALVTNKGTVQFIDTETKEVLITKDMIKSATAYYQYTGNADGYNHYNVGINFKFTSKGQSKLNEITKKYIETVDVSGETTQKTIKIQIDGEDRYETYFASDGQYTELPIPLYTDVSDQDEKLLDSRYTECLQIQSELSTETLPLKYQLATGTFLKTNTAKKYTQYGIIVAIAILAIISLGIIIKNKLSGLLTVIIELGYIAILLLLVRSANVRLTIAGVAMIGLMSLINLVMANTIAHEERAVQKLERFGKFILEMIPFIITVIVFAFSKEINLQSVGMVGAWGSLGFAYTILLTLALITKNTKKNGVEK